MTDTTAGAGAIPPRPRDIPIEAKQRVALELAASLRDDGCLDVGITVEEAASDIQAVAAQYMDGYKIAKRLDERFGWGCDLRTAEALDSFDTLFSAELKAAERAWVAEHKIVPTIAPGTRVKAKVGWETRECILVGVDEHYPARYRVRDASAPPESKSAWIVAFEDVVPIETPAEAPPA